MSESTASYKRDAEALVVEYLSDPRPDLKDLIIVQYSSMVERIARRFSGVESVDDLTQVGYIGLLNALSKFDPDAGVRFNTYATHLVAGEIKHYLRDRSQTIRQPAWLQELRHKVNKAVNEMHAELGRVPTDREVAERLEVSESAVKEVKATKEMLRVASLDASPGDDEDGDSDLDKLDASMANPDQVTVEDRVLLETAMQQLRDLEREVLVRFHFDAMNQTEIAAELGISCNYVSHILRQSLTKLRKILNNDEEQERILRRNVPDDKSVTDPETGIYDEGYFRARMTEEVHRAVSNEGVCSVITVEIDGLQELGNFYGEATVRDFLVDTAEFLQGSLRSLDILCRNGSTGFGIVLPGTGLGVENVVNRIESRLDKWLVGRMSGGNGIKFTIAHATAPDHGRTVSDLFKSLYRQGNAA